MDNKEKTVEDVLLSDEALKAVSGGAKISDKACPICGNFTLYMASDGKEIACRKSSCPFIMRC